MTETRPNPTKITFLEGFRRDSQEILSSWIDRLGSLGGRDIRRFPSWLLLLVGYSAILLIGLLSQFTDQRMSTSLLYLVPILLITLNSGFTIGLSAAVLAASIWFATDLRMLNELGGAGIPSWNAFMRLGTFCVVVLLVSAMKSMNRTLEERVAARTGELKAQLAENSALEKKILEVSDQEQSRIGQDLHDGLCQHLVSLAFSLNLVHQKIADSHCIKEQEIERMQGILDDAISQARDLARGLFPASLESEGLEIALRELAARTTERFKLPCSVECGAEIPPIQLDVSSQLYRIAQEAVTNSAKHAEASVVKVTVFRENRHCVLRVVDNGKGMAGRPATPDGMGFWIIAYRARMIGAQIRFETGEKGRGHAVICEWPIDLE